jgi:hypothetical protein
MSMNLDEALLLLQGKDMNERGGDGSVYDHLVNIVLRAMEEHPEVDDIEDLSYRTKKTTPIVGGDGTVLPSAQVSVKRGR